MTVGDVYWVELPTGAGRAQSGRRPAIIFQSAAASARLPTVLVVPLTSQVDALRFPGTILVEKDERNGLRRDSIAMLFQLTVLDRRSIKEQLGAVTAEVITAMYQVLDEITERSGSAADAAEEQL